jgi:hypothetical protein
MNHGALKEYVEVLLSDEHLSVLQKEADMRRLIFTDVLTSIQSISYRYMDAMMQRLESLAAEDAELLHKAKTWAQAREREQRWNKYRPIIVLGAAALICLLLWWLSRP